MLNDQLSLKRCHKKRQQPKLKKICRQSKIAIEMDTTTRILLIAGHDAQHKERKKNLTWTLQLWVYSLNERISNMVILTVRNCRVNSEWKWSSLSIDTLNETIHYNWTVLSEMSQKRAKNAASYWHAFHDFIEKWLYTCSLGQSFFDMLSLRLQVQHMYVQVFSFDMQSLANSPEIVGLF